MTKKEPDFEKNFQRLEEILEAMNSGEAGLDKSLKLYEEANDLIIACGKRLNEAEQKIEKLIKQRDGELALSDDGAPAVESFE
ncbi:Exodeoxyribonuclease 7 small subunit [Waddlia chondrophila 2032/99]|uniref:Exodeoxyribonuclease 7 small subunit n=2 Tax=Waddlia chondrophila TaxID=71667 RepID=D6YWK3_WADCW|nr:exodeoxyribonuclease VII small subunit [Waddlia chondrophila]ADI38514.1 Exodeoxyribonuclease 7 small subunit [Waddlia chondrophila WSU 86-1044]CCB91596.1 Exodeoxyribonuclease 7 small subunit [Waddlia chondrophila 2032/99]